MPLHCAIGTKSLRGVLGFRKMYKDGGAAIIDDKYGARLTPGGWWTVMMKMRIMGDTSKCCDVLIFGSCCAMWFANSSRLSGITIGCFSWMVFQVLMKLVWLGCRFNVDSFCVECSFFSFCWMNLIWKIKWKCVKEEMKIAFHVYWKVIFRKQCKIKRNIKFRLHNFLFSEDIVLTDLFITKICKKIRSNKIFL